VLEGKGRVIEYEQYWKKEEEYEMPPFCRRSFVNDLSKESSKRQ